MLLINTNVGKSRIKDAGQGLFTQQAIPKGSFIWNKSDRDVQIDRFAYNALVAMEAQGYVEKYGTQDENGNWYVDVDNCRFMNHSENPNIKFIYDVGVAVKDIKAGEELTCDYRTITTEQHYKQLLNIK